jgi:hypothetical protein
MLTKTKAIAVCALLSACGSPDYVTPPPQAAVPVGSLTHVLDMVDPGDGRLYGSVELDPVGGGRVFDIDGRLIGHIERDVTYYESYYDRDYPYREDYFRNYRTYTRPVVRPIR